MIGKVVGLARALAIILAVITAFVAIPNLNVALVLVVLGLIAGIAYSDETATRLFLAVLVLPLVSAALNTIPAVGEQLGAIATNVALAAAGAAATFVAIRLFNLVKDDLTGLASK
jgi:hypothetical protein